MFTGIVEEIGTVSDFSLSSKGAVIKVACSKVLEDVELGASISINGACQTVVEYNSSSFTVESTRETLNLTNLKNLKIGDEVNLERAMQMNGRLGGHIVSGHIEGEAKFVRVYEEGFSKILFFEIPSELQKYVVYKGSITVNGVSLTVASIEGNVFSVSVIPETIKQTNLKNLKVGDNVNIETDILAKYIEKLLFEKDNKKTSIGLEFLKENGFA